MVSSWYPISGGDDITPLTCLSWLPLAVAFVLYLVNLWGYNCLVSALLQVCLVLVPVAHFSSECPGSSAPDAGLVDPGDL